MTGEKIRLRNKTEVQKLKAPGVYWDESITGFGCRVNPGGARTFFYQGRIGREGFKITLGALGRRGYTAKQAENDALDIEAKLRLNQDPRVTKPEGKTPTTFGDLLTAYADTLEKRGKESARAVRNCVVRNVQKPFPKLWKKLAADVTLEDCFTPIDALIEAGSLREADKLRAYIKTAFKTAINAKRDPNTPAHLRGFGIRYNPISEMQKVEGSSVAKDRALSLTEFRAYWQRIGQLPEPRRSLATLHVLTGGQRQKQLGRVTFNELDRDAPSLLLWDSKGRRKSPRAHVVPLLPEALACIDTISSGPFVFSNSGGKKPAGIDYLNDIVRDVCTSMAKGGELEGAPFTAGTIRATVETQLMRNPYNVSSDILAQLLSHGMGSVQNKHYVKEVFFEEKRKALLKLYRMLNDKPSAKVVKLRGRA